MTFNYVVTIHNKETLLERTLFGLWGSSRQKNVRIFAVLDGCTDGSEAIVDRFIGATGADTVKITLPDVHEIRSINAALSKIEGGYTICLQDDVILDDPELEQKIEALYEREGSTLGVVSLRHSANVRPSTLLERMALMRRFGLKAWKGSISECDRIGMGEEFTGEKMVSYGQFVERMVAIKSPVVIPYSVLSRLNGLDEKLAPYSYCDHEYCLRAIKLGFRNGVFPVNFRSELEWGGTRQDSGFARASAPIHFRNRQLIWVQHKQLIRYLRRLNAVAINSPPPIPEQRGTDS